MNNYDNKLKEWLKYVEQQVGAVQQDVSDDEKSVADSQQAVSDARLEQERLQEKLMLRDRMGRPIADDLPGTDPTSIIADSSLIERPREVERREPALFEETDVPDVEDFLPFLREPENQVRIPEERVGHRSIIEDRSVEKPLLDEPSLPFSEGTGEPKPIIRPTQPPVEDTVKPVEPPIASQVVVEPPKREEATPPVERIQEPEKQNVVSAAVLREEASSKPVETQDAAVNEMWGKLPKHIRLLMETPSGEVAQNSYKQFKESREDLISRLLDPMISLEETARILNVCPTTVRRYTNKGTLNHIRTAGNQRRFRLSDVLAFLEAQASKTTTTRATQSESAE